LSKKNVPKSAQTLLNRPVFPRAHCEENGKNIGGFMPFCSKCGTQVPEGSQFCSSCGNKQGEQRGNSLGNFLGDAWNPGKTIIAIALIIAFVMMFIPWIQLATSPAGGSVTANGWGSVSKTGLIIIVNSKDINETAGIISFVGIAAFLISLALGIYAITRKQIPGTKFGAIVILCAVLLIIDLLLLISIKFYYSQEGLEGGGLLSGYYLFFISVAANIFGIFYSNKFLRNDVKENVNDVRGKLKELGL